MCTTVQLVLLSACVVLFAQPDAEGGGLPIGDPCGARVPPQLAVQLNSAFPSYRLPRIEDSDPEVVNENRNRGGDGCISVTAADFDGDGRTDIALLIHPRRRGATILVAARQSAPGWHLSKLRTLLDVNRRDLYVATLEPGTFVRTESADGPFEKGEVPRITTRRKGIAVGLVESSEMGYFFDDGAWKHVWIAD